MTAVIPILNRRKRSDDQAREAMLRARRRTRLVRLHRTPSVEADQSPICKRLARAHNGAPVRGAWTVIAVVEDEVSVRKALIRVLHASGLAVRGFATGREFLDSWHIDRPECLVLDLQMPELSGQEVHHALRMAGATFPIVIVTAHDAPNLREECMRMGAAAYLQKPVDVDALLRAVLPGIQGDSRPPLAGEP